jgi:hypothetical protein
MKSIENWPKSLLFQSRLLNFTSDLKLQNFKMLSFFLKKDMKSDQKLQCPTNKNNTVYDFVFFLLIIHIVIRSGFFHC